MSYRTAQEKIKSAKYNDLKELNLSKMMLKKVPPEIAKLTRLESLNLSINRLTSLPSEIFNLVNLRNLRLDVNELNQLPPEIISLSKLERLWLNANELTSLPMEISGLFNLESIHLSDNEMTYWPPELCFLPRLQSLSLNSNQIERLPPEIGNLRNLKVLYLQNNPLAYLPAELGSLSKLQRLWLCELQLTSLPSEMKKLNNLEFLFLHENLELGIPPEILGPTWEDVGRERRTPAKPADILDYYFKSAAQTAHPINEAKVILVGQGKVGKTSLVNRLLYDKHNSDENKTEGIDIHNWMFKLKNTEVKLNVWDFGGQEIMHATHQFFLTKRSIYFLVLDSRLDRQANRVDYWLRLIESYGGESPVIIICNQCDQQMMDLDWAGLRRNFPTIRNYVRAASCKNGEGMSELYRYLLEEIDCLEHMGDKIPSTWFAVKIHLEELKEDENFDYLSLNEYRNLCKEKGVVLENEQHRLLRFLNDLGVMLYYDHLGIAGLNILNPEWVTSGVYAILNNKELLNKRNGVLKREFLSRILNPNRYPSDRHDFILQMMIQFELCFKIEGPKEQEFLIPDLLSEEMPDVGKWDDVLRFKFRYDVLPSSVISRFIVRMHIYIEKSTYWKNGVVLIYKYNDDGDNNHALIKADEDQKEISILISGPESDRREFLSIIRSEFRIIHASISKLNVEEKIPLPDKPEVEEDYHHLDKMLQAGIKEHWPSGADHSYSISDLLNGVDTPQERSKEQKKQIQQSQTNIEDIPDTFSQVRDVYYVQGDVKHAERDIHQVGRDQQIGNKSHKGDTYTADSIRIKVKKNDLKSLSKHLMQQGLSESDLIELKNALANDPIPQSNDQFGEKVGAWVGKMTVKAATGAWQISTSAAGSLLASAIGDYYGISQIPHK